MKKVTGVRLAGAALCLALFGAAPAMAQTDTQNPTPLTPQVQPPVLQPQPTVQTRPAYQSGHSALPYLGHNPNGGVYNSPPGAPQPKTNSLPVYPSPVTPTPQLLDNGPAMETAARPVKHKAKKHKTTRRKSSHKTGHKKSAKRTVHSSGKSHVRAAQVYLDELGYDPGPTDGVMGRKTKAAIKEFQRDHDIKATGTLTDKTFAALENEAGSRNPKIHGGAPQADFVATHPDFYGYYGNEGISPTSQASPQTIPSRFGNLDVSEQRNGPTSNYTVSVNGQPVYRADNQPSYINVSRTFEVDDVDAIVLTSYNNGNTVCPYKHQLLVIKSSGSNLRDMANCTQDYEAYTENGMLMISFPGNHVDGLSTGESWRYDHGTFEKL